MALVRWSRRRAHLGGRSLDGTTHSMLARRQLEHGDSLSQRTLRLRHTTQLRGLRGRDASADGDVEELAVVVPGAVGAAVACTARRLPGLMLRECVLWVFLAALLTPGGRFAFILSST